MKRGSAILTPAAAALLAVLVLAAGCGEKIAIPEPVGQWSLAPYSYFGQYFDPDGPIQLTQSSGTLFVVSPTTLTKRNQDYEVTARFDGLDGGAAVCVDPVSGFVFLWQQGPGRISWHRSDDLSAEGFTDVAGVGRVVAMEANPSGVELFPGAVTFLYLSDPETGLIHRYAFDPFTGLSPYGILARSDGDGTRFVHTPAGLATDYQDSLLVCDADTNRNWVIRFVSAPDTTDTNPVPGEDDELRGRATLFDAATCVPPAAADFVIGNAAECGQSDWVGAPSDQDGEFNAPQAVAVAGDGRIFVADSRNDRIQIFDPQGYFDLWFGNADIIAAPTSLALVEKRTGTAADEIFPAGFVYVLVPTEGKIVRFIDRDYFNARSESQPPPPPP